MAFQQIEKLGTGYFGEVWLERDEALGRDCAAKYLNPDRVPRGSDPLAAAAAQLPHDHLVTVYSAELEHAVPVIRMEYLAAGSVPGHFGSGPLPVATAIELILDAASGLEHLHSSGVLHRDIKPANLLLSSALRVKVADAGLGSSQDAADALQLPPEAVAGSGMIDTVAGDIYALGITLYRLLEGDARMVSEVAGPELDALVAEGLFPERTIMAPHIHRSLRRVVTKALEVDPAERFLSMSELREALRRARPVIFFTPSSDGTAWTGSSQDGSVEWRVRLVGRSGGFDFQAERQVGGRGFRKVPTVGARCRNIELGLVAARKALEKIATDR